jgi:hypothetical protein
LCCFLVSIHLHIDCKLYVGGKHFLNIIKYSWTTSRAKWLSDEKTNVSRTISVLVFRVLMYLEKQSTPSIGLPEFHTGLYLALRHLPKTAIAFITKLFNVVLRW